MSFEDETSTEIKEFFSSKIDKVLGSKLDKLDKLDKIFEEISLLRSENKDLQQQNILLTQQVANLKLVSTYLKYLWLLWYNGLFVCLFVCLRICLQHITSGLLSEISFRT